MSADLSNDEAMARLVAEIARGLVADADAIRVAIYADETSRVVRLQVGPHDFGYVLGTHGRTAKSIRTIVAAASHRLQQRYTLDIAEDSATLL